MWFQQPAADLSLWFLIRKKPPSHSTAATYIRDRAQALFFSLNILGEAFFLAATLKSMESTWRICVCFYCCLHWLASSIQCSPRSSRAVSDKTSGLLVAPEDNASELNPLLRLPKGVRRGYALLPPLLKVLSDRGHQHWESEVPRLQPDSRALRYMKRLYKMAATKEGIPKANKSHLYNTVRLFTPCSECEHHHRDLMKGRCGVT